MGNFEVKVLEVRDKATFIPVMAIRLGGGSDQEQWLVSRAGFGQTPEQQGRFVIFLPLDGSQLGQSHYDPHRWSGTTLFQAHIFIQENWAEIKSGEVIDVEFLRGDSKESKKSERGE